MNSLPIITLTGCVATGKTTLAGRLLTALPNARMLTSVTTRAPRSSDLNGEYCYVTESDFETLQKEDAFEWTTPPMRGHNYASRVSDLDYAFRNTHHVWITIPVPGILRKLYRAAERRDARHRIHSFFIRSPRDEAVLRQRLKNDRNLTDEKIASDLAHCADWETQARESGVPLRYIEDTNDLDEKFRQIWNAVFR